KKKVWLDPIQTNGIAKANSRQQTRKLIKDGLIIRKPTKRLKADTMTGVTRQLLICTDPRSLKVDNIG
ncbi:hypothetical protein A6R68_17767, partial [Neotoma lepida]